MDVDVDLTGGREIQQFIDRARRKMPDAVGAALYEQGVRVMTKSKKKTPVDTGRLRSSGFVSAPIKERMAQKIIIGYGTEYAIYVHEDTDARHEVGDAKFLQRPLEDAQSGMAEQVAKSIRNMVKNDITLGSIMPESEFPEKPKPST